MRYPDALIPAQPPLDESRWQAGVDRPNVGDLWVTAWEGKDLGLVMIVAVRESHVVVWPVTDQAITPSAPCFHVEADWLRQDLVGWPEAEAGLSYATLDRNLGHVADSRTLRGIWDAVRTGGDLPDVQTFPADESETADAALASVCSWVTALGHLDFPDPDEVSGTLNRTFAERHGITARDIATIVGGAPAIARQIADGSRLLPGEAITTLSTRFEVSPNDLVQRIEGPEVSELRAPQRKAKIVSLAQRRGARENDVRLDAWQESRLAARQQRGESQRAAAAARVDRALDLLDQSI